MFHSLIDPTYMRCHDIDSISSYSSRFNLMQLFIQSIHTIGIRKMIVDLEVICLVHLFQFSRCYDDAICFLDSSLHASFFFFLPCLCSLLDLTMDLY